jgi:hydrogen peroxide-dependent heme synthase
MTDETIFSAYPVFRAEPERIAQADREVAAKELDELLENWSDRVTTRGIYTTTGFRADADVVFWFVARSTDNVQDLMVELRRTRVGRALVAREMFLGVVRPAEFAPDHLPAFVQQKDPKKYLCVYPFVRTPEWYLLDKSERGRYLSEHGEAGRRYSDVLANTVSAFGLGDYEWILAFEADGPERIVELIRHLRETEARRYTKLEIPFFTGIRKDAAGIVGDLP